MVDPVELLQRLIATPSISRDEVQAAALLRNVLQAEGIPHETLHNNTLAVNSHYDPARPTLLLNSHIDTVKASPSYTFDPFKPQICDGRLYGLGSNDAGASVVSLLTAFLALYDEELPVNLVLALTAEEEVMGERGMRAALPWIRERYPIDMAIVGEPTGMHPAIAERGLVVLDCTAHGITGHAARDEGVNALYKALDDIQAIRNLRFDNTSAVLGDIKLTVTQIEAGRQHNVVPETCRFVVDVRTTDAYTNEETVEHIRAVVGCEVTPRSTRIRASVIDRTHPLVVAAVGIGGVPYVSPTTSDMAAMPDIPSLKIGPGDSSRSHSADEYIIIDEIHDAVTKYQTLIRTLKI